MAASLSKSQRSFHISATLISNESESSDLNHDFNHDMTESDMSERNCFLVDCQSVEFYSSPDSPLDYKIKREEDDDDDTMIDSNIGNQTQRPMLAIPIPTRPIACTHGQHLCHRQSCIQPFIDTVISSIGGISKLHLHGVLRSRQSYVDDVSSIGRGYHTDSYSFVILLLTAHLPNDPYSSSSPCTTSSEYNTLQNIAKEIYGHHKSASLQQDTPLVPLMVHQIHFYTALALNTTLSNPKSSSNYSLPLCPVCLFRIEPRFYGNLWNVPTHSQCSHTCTITEMNPPIEPTPMMYDLYPPMCRNMSYLLNSQSYPCKACPLIQQRMISSPIMTVDDQNNKESSFTSKLTCYSCQMKETLWVCLTCGMVGCGRYSMGHAEQHFHESNHPWALELATQRVWDYSVGSFSQRNDLISCPLMRRLVMMSTTNPSRFVFGSSSSSSRNHIPNHTINQESLPTTNPIKDEDSLFVSKSQSIGEEYEVLLQSALDDQARHYEDEISKLHSLLATTRNSNSLVSSDPLQYFSTQQRVEEQELRETIVHLRHNIETLSQDIVEVQTQEAQHQAKSKILLRQQELTQSILTQLRDQVKKEWISATAQIDDYEQQIQDLTNNIQMRQQILGNVELIQSEIVGCTRQEDTVGSGSKLKSRTGQRSKKH